MIEEATILYRWYVINAKRFFIPDPASRLRNLNLFTSKSVFLKHMAMPDENRVYGICLMIMVENNGAHRANLVKKGLQSW